MRSWFGFFLVCLKLLGVWGSSASIPSKAAQGLLLKI